MKLRLSGLLSSDAARRGMVAVQVALSLTMLMGVSAMAVDGGILMAQRRHTQAAADAAALAGAVNLFKNYPTYTGKDTPGTAKSAATAYAQAHFKDPANPVVVSVSIPPTTAQTSYFNGKDGYIEVNLTYNQPRGFSAIWDSAPIPIKGHAIARGQWVLPGQGIITLDPTGVRTVNTNGGNTNLTVNGGTVIVNSNNGAAVDNAGSITSTGTNITGNYTGGGTYSPTPTTGTPPVEDPLKALPAPSPPPAGKITSSTANGITTHILEPGSYDAPGASNQSKLPGSGFGSKDVVIFKQASANAAGGIYYLYTGLKSTGATIMMDGATSGGLMFYNAGTKNPEAFSISGSDSGSVNLSALTSGIYKGILYFQARGSTQDVSVSGNGTFTMLGTFYAPDAGLKITGNGPTSIIGSQYISKNLTLGGTGSIVIDYSSGLVAPVRRLNLVE